MPRGLPAAAVLAAALLAAPAARASYFEFCDLGGTVATAVVEDPARPRVVTVTVAIDSAARARELGDISYSDCGEHVGETLEAWLEMPAAEPPPAAGDYVCFSRSVVDGFDHDGNFAGTSTKTELIELRRAKGDP